MLCSSNTYFQRHALPLEANVSPILAHEHVNGRKRNARWWYDAIIVDLKS